MNHPIRPRQDQNPELLGSVLLRVLAQMVNRAQNPDDTETDELAREGCKKQPKPERRRYGT